MINSFKNIKQPTEFGNTARDNIMQFQLDNETGYKLNVNVSTSDLVTIEMLSKTGKVLGSGSFTIVKNKILKSVTLDSANKQLIFLLADSSEIYCDLTELYNLIDTKQDLLISGENIKTINNSSILGSGDIQLQTPIELYLKSASVSGQTLTLTNKNDTTISFTPTENNYTTDEKNKLSNIESNAQVNIIEEVDVNGTKIEPTDKKVNINVPVSSSDLSDGSNLLKKADIINNVTTEQSGKVLDASQGKVLQDEIDNLKAIGRYLSGWDCSAGLAVTSPSSLPYVYKTGDYFIITNVSDGTNYKPNGTEYTGDKSTTEETQVVKVNDYYRYDGTVWNLEINSQRVTTWGSITGTLSNQLDLKESLDSKAEEKEIKYTNTNGCTVSVGGIAKGTTFDNTPLKTILEDMLYPYVAFTFNSISTNPTAKTYEYGDSKTITTVTPSFTLGSKSISMVKVGSTSGGSDLYTGTTATSGQALTLTTTKTIDGTVNATIYCTLSDGTNSVEKSATFTFSKYYYYTVTTSTDIPTTATNNGTSNEKDGIVTTDNSYIWFLSPTTKTKIQQYAMNQWNDMTTTSAGATLFTTSTGKQLTYYAYRTDKMMSDTGRYRIV